jgi:hypothetical protein
MRLETQTKRLTRKGTVVARESSPRPGRERRALLNPRGIAGGNACIRSYRICSQPMLGRNRNALTWPEATSNGSTLTPESVRKC